MKNKKINVLLILGAILVQSLLYQSMSFELYKLPFASSLMIFESQKANLLLILYAFVPVPFILFEFSGRGRELTEGYGKVWIIRSYKREWLCLKIIKNIALELLAIVLCLVLAFSFGEEKWKNISLKQAVWIVMAYYVGLMAVILLQFYLELFLEPSYANMITNVFFVLSLFIGNSVLTLKRFRWLGFLLFPNMLFGVRNGMIEQQNIEINYEYAFLYLIAVSAILCLLAVLKFRKKDIY